MPVLCEMWCTKCGKKTFHEYMPRCTIKSSYWKCRSCEERNRLGYQLRNKETEMSSCTYGYIKRKKYDNS